MDIVGRWAVAKFVVSALLLAALSAVMGHAA